MAASVMMSSEVSAMVTHGLSDTHRVPRPSTMNLFQDLSMRFFASAPVTAPLRTG